MTGSFVLITREELLLVAGMEVICGLLRCYGPPVLQIYKYTIFENGCIFCISASMEMKLRVLTCLWKYEIGIFPIFLHCLFFPELINT